MKNKLDGRYGCFEIFGFDFLLAAEDDLSPRLMDITSCPSFSTEFTETKTLIRSLLRDSVTMASDLHEKNREKAREFTIEKVVKCGKNPYQVIYREAGAKD